MLIAMLQAPTGASIAEIVAATGWQAHTVRGSISGALKTKLGFWSFRRKSRAGDQSIRSAEVAKQQLAEGHCRYWEALAATKAEKSFLLAINLT